MEEEGYKVRLNVYEYDISLGSVRQLSTFLGRIIRLIWHTRVLVYGYEYHYAGELRPYEKPITVVDLGITHVPREVFHMYVEGIRPRFTEDTFSILSHNSNTYSNELAQFLVGKGIPDWILQIPNTIINSPMAPRILPMLRSLESTLTAGGEPQDSQYKILTWEMDPITNRPMTPVPLKFGEVYKSGDSKISENYVPPAVEPAESKEKPSIPDALRDKWTQAREEVSRQFEEINGIGIMRASEAAVLATRRVMLKYGLQF